MKKKRPSRGRRQALVKLEGPLQIDTGGNVSVRLWELEDPQKSYNASTCNVSTEAGAVVTHFAQALPSGRVVSAVSVALPANQVSSILETFGTIKDRLASSKYSRGVKPLSEKALEKLDSRSWLRWSAHVVRSATNDDYSVLDFYELPMMPREAIENHPERLQVKPIVRITLTPYLLKYWLKIAAEASP